MEKRNIFITGATGSGKTYLSCAFGHEACAHYLSTIFIRIPDLLGELRTAAGDAEEFRNDRKLMKVIEKYTKPKLLILDEWLLIAPSPKDVELLFEIIHKRSEKKVGMKDWVEKVPLWLTYLWTESTTIPMK